MDDQKPIIRFAHNSAPQGASSAHIVYEVNPPVFTIRKVPSTQQTAQLDAAAVKVVASRIERFQSFLARAKQAAGIPLQHKVKIFRQLDPTKISGDMPDIAQPGIPSPPTSRNPSPSPSTSKLIIENSVFAKWTEGTNFESIDGHDHTANDKYNGKLNLETLGLISNQVLILEEQQRAQSLLQMWLRKATRTIPSCLKQRVPVNAPALLPQLPSRVDVSVKMAEPVVLLV
ncbi:unnamed protein product [Aureobasidium mustum]|uniref:Uncharacterized protein n=1 Tax=Aureobasidium mustum TaxID=2773714 RepID=A0A9N8K5Y7_9PEZI|nr:unnamed protein product [Aureobasidium mustum]